MLRPSGQGLNMAPTTFLHIRRGLCGHVEAMLRPSGQGLNIPPTKFPHIRRGLCGYVEALPTLVIIILKGYACGPQHPTWPDATRQYYSPAPLPKSAPPRGGGQTKNTIESNFRTCLNQTGANYCFRFDSRGDDRGARGLGGGCQGAEEARRAPRLLWP